MRVKKMGIKTIARAIVPKELVSLYKSVKRNKIVRTLQKNYAGIIDSFREKRNIPPPPPRRTLYCMDMLVARRAKHA
jgi:hypothetical protein